MRLGYIGGQFVPFPTHDALEESDLDLIVSGSKDSILMIEGFAREMPEDLMAEAIVDRPRVHPRKSAKCRKNWSQKVGRREEALRGDRRTDELFDMLRAKYYDAFRTAKQTEGKQARAEACSTLKQQAVAEMIPDPAAEGRDLRRGVRRGLDRRWKPGWSAT